MELDLRGVCGGQAAVKLRQALRWMAHGEELAVVWDEPQVGKELELFCRRSGDDFLRLEDDSQGHAAKIIRTNRIPAPQSPEGELQPGTS